MTTSLEVRNGQFVFPIFRFCNLNPAPYSAVKSNTELMAVLVAIQDKFGVSLSEFDPPKKPTTISDAMTNASKAYSITDLSNARSVFGQKLQTVLSGNGESDNSTLTHSIDNMILKCRFQGEDCHQIGLQYITQQDHLYGTCFEVKAENARVYQEGPDQGLELTLFLEHDEFVPFIAEAVGINTRIYPSDNQNIFLEESSDGIKLSAGFDIHIGLTLTEYNRQPGTDNTRCDNTKQFPTLLACLENCLSVLVDNNCKCENISGKCEAAKVDQCKKSYRKSLSTNCPNCKPPCNEKKYNQRITMTRWPSKSEEPLIHSTLRTKNKQVTSLRDNVMIVRVYFTSLMVQAFNEEESYTEENFVSDIGGQLGLWVGMSVLTLAEIVELGILIIIGLCKKLKREPTHVIPVNCKSSPLDITIEDFSNPEKKA